MLFATFFSGHAHRLLLRCAWAALSVAQCPTVFAQSIESNAPDARHNASVYLQGNWALHDTSAAGIGITLPWKHWRKPLWGGEVRGHWDIYAGRLRFDGIHGSDHSWMIGVVPTLRWRGDNGQSPWFWEAGLGIVGMTDRYRTTRKEFSTNLNFSTHLGLGYSFGERHRHEIQLQIEHISNAGIRHPNPGENFVRVRYGFHF